MLIADAQREVRTVFLGGFPGMTAAAIVWLASAAAATWISPPAGIQVLVIGGAFLFPIGQLVLRLMRRPASLSKQNPMSALAMQIAFTIPLTLPVVFAATAYRRDWFYPAMMIVVGAHYLPFTFLYGMKQYLGMAALLIGGGVAIGMLRPDEFAMGGWIAGATFALAAVPFRVWGRG